MVQQVSSYRIVYQRINSISIQSVILGYPIHCAVIESLGVKSVNDTVYSKAGKESNTSGFDDEILIWCLIGDVEGDSYGYFVVIASRHCRYGVMHAHHIHIDTSHINFSFTPSCRVDRQQCSQTIW